MKFSSKIFFPLFFSVCLPAFSRGAQELIPASSWIYDAAAAIGMEAGIVNFADSTPITIAEMKSYLGEIDSEKLSAAGKKQYERIFEWFDEKGLGLESSLMSLTAEPSVNLEGYYKTNNDISWIFDRYDRAPVIDLPVTLAMNDFVTMQMDLYLSQNKNTMAENDTYTNVPLQASDFDVNFPDSAYLSTGYGFNDECGVEFMFGSPEKSIGRTGTKSLIYSENVTGATTGQLSLYSPNLKYTASITQLGTYSDIHTNAADSGDYAEYETSNGAYLYMHQLEARLFKRLTLTAVEGLSVYAPFEMRYLNPLTIMHGYAAWRDYGYNEAYTCDYFGLKFNYIPARYWRLYGLFAMSQFQTPYELDIAGDDVTPSSDLNHMCLTAMDICISRWTVATLNRICTCERRRNGAWCAIIAKIWATRKTCFMNGLVRLLVQTRLAQRFRRAMKNRANGAWIWCICLWRKEKKLTWRRIASARTVAGFSRPLGVRQTRQPRAESRNIPTAFPLAAHYRRKIGFASHSSRLMS